ncbi:MAG: YfhO family protein [Paludibacteraceae bacterium]|nr:YfhO family protein [Paludibacteraceae bacterium]
MINPFCMKNFDWKKLLPYVVAVVLFLVFAIGYCSPLLQGKVLYAGDVKSWEGAAQEARTFKQQTGETTWWTNSMFGGMPAYQVTGTTPANEIRGVMERVIRLGFSREDGGRGVLFGYLIGFYLMLLCFGINPWLSLIGSFALSLSSYFLLIIPAGHISKAAALGILPVVMGGLYAIFRKKYWLGIPLFTVWGIVGINLHPQMTYYLCMLIGVCCFAELYIHIREKRWKDLGVAVGILLLCCALIYGTKLSWFQMNNEYLAETMRGGHSELTQPDVDKSKPAGLDIDYATAWSYGKAETFTFLIPNFMGGASGYNVGEKSVLYEEMIKARVPRGSAKQFCQQAPTYWGEKAFTSGPVYMGAIVCFLFVLGLIIVPGPYKWALLIATLFSVLLAWGRNFMPFTQFFYDYFPMYNKFRAVESILVVAEITMPLLGFLGLKHLMEAEDKKQYLKPIFTAAGITAGLCLVFALFGGSLFDFTSSYDAQWKGQVGDLYDLILDQRAAMLKADAWRSFIFIGLAAATLLWYVHLTAQRSNSESGPSAKRSFSPKGVLYTIFGVLILADMVPVDRRFFNKDHFVSKKESERYFAMQPWEEQILQDKSLDYRVLNVAANTFNDSRTSYRLKSVGGYSAVKLRRYQDLIDAHISRNNWNVLNMLNTKYIITRDGVFPNPEALGNAWFVDSLLCVNTPDAESEALNTLDLRHAAVMDTTFAPNQVLLRDWYGSFPTASRRRTDGEDLDRAIVNMTSYAPNKLVYEAQTDSAQLAVFSEIYYPHDWHLYIDGEEAPIYRVNYTLRAAIIPQGKHELVMEFVPAALKTDKWCMAIYILAIALSLFCVGKFVVGKIKKVAE